MTITQEQRTYARLAGICILTNIVAQGFGDGVTIIGRSGETFTETARFAAESPVLWRFALLNVGVAWIMIGILAFALYALLEPVNRRLAQLALVLRLGASFVGAASLMFRYAQAWVYSAVDKEGFTIEQLRALEEVIKRGAGAGVVTSWMFLGAGSTLFFVLFLRSRYLPGAMARFNIFASVLMVAASFVMFVYPEYIRGLKALLLPSLLADLATAFWLLFKGLHPRAKSEEWG